MTIDLPTILQKYFQAQNAHDIEAMVACFAADATVRDEGRDIIGADAIRAWKVETSAKYRITIEPVRRPPRGGQDNCCRQSIRHISRKPGEPNLPFRLFG